MAADRGEPGGGEGGFTLLEVIIVLVVLGFLMIGLTQGVRVGLGLWHAQSRRVDQTAELDAAARVLRNLLTAIPVLPAASSSTANGSAMSGSADHFTFPGDLPTALGAVQRCDVTLALHGNRLMLSWVPHRHEATTAPPPRPTESELVGAVTRLELAYWGTKSPDQPPGWRASWEGPESPQLIRVRLRFGKSDQRRWPDLIVASQL